MIVRRGKKLSKARRIVLGGMRSTLISRIVLTIYTFKLKTRMEKQLQMK